MQVCPPDLRKVNAPGLGVVSPFCFRLSGNMDKRISRHSGVDDQLFNPLSPKIDFYVDLLICATSWASNHKFILL